VSPSRIMTKLLSVPWQTIRRLGAAARCCKKAKRGVVMSYQPVPALGKDWLTPFYDVLVAVGGLGAQLTKRVLQRALIQDGERVLDVGCATATRLIAAKARYPTAHLVGVDPDERA